LILSACRFISGNSSEKTSSEIGLTVTLLQDVARERFEIRDADFAHERRVCRQPLDERIGVQLQHSFFVAPSAKIFIFEVFECFA